MENHLKRPVGKEGILETSEQVPIPIYPEGTLYSRKMVTVSVWIRGLSLNIVGLNNPFTWRHIYNLLKKESINIACKRRDYGRWMKDM